VFFGCSRNYCTIAAVNCYSAPLHGPLCGPAGAPRPMEILFIFTMIGTSPASFICFSRPARLEVLPWCTAMKLTFYLLHRRSKISRYLLVLFSSGEDSLLWADQQEYMCFSPPCYEVCNFFNYNERPRAHWGSFNSMMEMMSGSIPEAVGQVQPFS
jgi:hypothetical protein